MNIIVIQNKNVPCNIKNDICNVISVQFNVF